MDENYKTAEVRARRAAKRQGLRLEKSRQRDPNGILHGTFQLVDERTGAPVAADWALGRGYGLTLEEIVEVLNNADSRR